MKKTILSLSFVLAVAFVATAEPAKTLKVGDAAPAFKIKNTSGKEIDLNKLTAKGPVLVRLTCGCLGCDRELPRQGQKPPPWILLQSHLQLQMELGRLFCLVRQNLCCL